MQNCYYEGKISIFSDPYGDDWKPSSENDISAEKFRRSTYNHRIEVMMCMDYIAGLISEAGNRHDFSKESQSGLFFRDFINWKLNGVDMDEGEWFPMHVKAERHHLRDNVPDDVNLIDVVEMICDCVCAGLARSHSVRPVEIDADILKKAVQNTANLLIERCRIIGVDVVEPPESWVERDGFYDTYPDVAHSEDSDVDAGLAVDGRGDSSGNGLAEDCGETVDSHGGTESSEDIGETESEVNEDNGDDVGDTGEYGGEERT